MLGVPQIIRRAQRAAEYAHDWAVWRHDISMEEVRIAALYTIWQKYWSGVLLQNQGLDIRALQTTNPNMRSTDAQTQVIGFSFAEIQHSLCKIWHSAGIADAINRR